VLDAEALYAQALAALAGQQLVQAELLLRQLMREHPDFAAAWLELGLLHCLQGQPELARALWDELLLRFEAPPGIVALVAHLRSSACVPGADMGLAGAGADVGLALPGAAGVAPVLLLELGRGHSSNVNQGVTDLYVELPGPQGPLALQLQPQFAARPDGFYRWRLALDAPLPGAPGWHGLAQWQGQLFDSESTQHLQSLALGLRRPWQLGAWQGQWLGALDWLERGGALHQRRGLLQAQVQVPVPPGLKLGAGAPRPQLRQWLLTARLVHTKVAQQPAFDGLQSSLSSSLSGAWGALQWQAEAGLDWDRAASALRPGGDMRGGHLGAQVQHPLGQVAGRPLQLLGQWQWQHWRSSQAYAPGLIELRREQNLHQASLALRWQQSPATAWRLDWRWLQNDENIALFAYRGHSVQLLWKQRWPGPGGRP